MSSFAPASKRTRSEDTFEWKEGQEFFPGNNGNIISNYANYQQQLCNCCHCLLDVSKIQYRPDAPIDDVMVFRHYDASEVSCNWYNRFS